MAESGQCFGLKCGHPNEEGPFCLFVSPAAKLQRFVAFLAAADALPLQCFMTVRWKLGKCLQPTVRRKEKSLRLDIGRWTTVAFITIEHTAPSYALNSGLLGRQQLRPLRAFFRYRGGPGGLVSRPASRLSRLSRQLRRLRLPSVRQSRRPWTVQRFAKPARWARRQLRRAGKCARHIELDPRFAVGDVLHSAFRRGFGRRVSARAVPQRSRSVSRSGGLGR